MSLSFLDLKPGCFHVVTDGQWGSCGKGHATTALAARYRPEYLSTTSMANAGHTAEHDDGERFVAKALPSAAILNKWLQNTTRPYNPYIIIGATAAFDLNQILQEINICGNRKYMLIHPRAGIITQNHRDREQGPASAVRHLASTMQGCGEFLAEKVLRRRGLLLARDYPELGDMIANDLHVSLNTMMTKMGSTILHEGSQGYSLDINHGSHYPQCTSRGTTAIQNLADMGFNSQRLGDVFLVIRPYPIRVGNVEGGYSGHCYPDQIETTWENVFSAGGYGQIETKDLKARELTTVTKRQRRVFSFSERQVREAATVNGATKIILNFADQIDHKVRGVRRWDLLTHHVTHFVAAVERATGIPVTMVGTGSALSDFCWKDGYDSPALFSAKTGTD